MYQTDTLIYQLTYLEVLDRIPAGREQAGERAHGVLLVQRRLDTLDPRPVVHHHTMRAELLAVAVTQVVDPLAVIPE